MKTSSLKSLTFFFFALFFFPLISIRAFSQETNSTSEPAVNAASTSEEAGGSVTVGNEVTAPSTSGLEAPSETEDLTAPAPMLKSEAKVVKGIDVVGNKSIGVATILSKIKTRVGQEYIENVISDDLKRLYNTGYFSDVKVDKKDVEGGYKVIINLVEKPIVEEITFSKLRYFNKRSLETKDEDQKR
jgi:hypothetical protein